MQQSLTSYGSCQAGRWVVYLNIPRPTDARFDHWEKRSYSTAAIAARLQERGFAVDANFVPLARRTTVRDTVTKHCLMWDGFAWVERPRGFRDGSCAGPEVTHHEFTFTEWEVRDLNGDGYPDVAFNSSQIGSDTQDDPFPPPLDSSEIQYTTINSYTSVHLAQTNQIHAVFNVLGVRVEDNSQPYGVAVMLRPTQCGVALWDEVDTSHQEQICGFAVSVRAEPHETRRGRLDFARKRTT